MSHRRPSRAPRRKASSSMRTITELAAFLGLLSLIASGCAEGPATSTANAQKTSPIVITATTTTMRPRP